MSEIAANINKLMTAEGISASELSRKTGVDRSVLHKILSGATKNPSIDSIKTIIQHYGFAEVVLGTPSKPDENEIPLLLWSEVANLPHIAFSSRHKMVKTGTVFSETSFALQVEYTLDSRFPAGALLIVDTEKIPQNFSYVIMVENATRISSIKRYIFDGSLIYLKSIDPSFPSIRYQQEEHNIVGVVIQSLLNFE